MNTIKTKGDIMKVQKINNFSLISFFKDKKNASNTMVINTCLKTQTSAPQKEKIEIQKKLKETKILEQHKKLSKPHFECSILIGASKVEKTLL